MALALDEALPFDADAKRALLRCQASRARQFLLPIVRPLARLAIVLVQLVRVVAPRFPDRPRLLHRLMVWGMRRFLSPDANLLVLRHFHLGSEILAFIADNATPGFRPALHPLRPKRLEDLRDNAFVKHDINLFNFLIALNQELDRRGDRIAPRAALDFSAIGDAPLAFDGLPRSWTNVIDVHTAIELYTPLYAAFLTDRDFWRASNSLQLDETVALYAARLVGQESHLGLVNNRHPLVPIATLEAGFRLMLHGLATELLHAFLKRAKAAQDGAAPISAARAGAGLDQAQTPA
ncbi:MAG: hypothetical protein JNK11_00335 [Alphaproteobacteria bacterium]|nr:hypothetical protein [Alphaproteobacteria bacterium]